MTIINQKIGFHSYPIDIKAQIINKFLKDTLPLSFLIVNDKIYKPNPGIYKLTETVNVSNDFKINHNYYYKVYANYDKYFASDGLYFYEIENKRLEEIYTPFKKSKKYSNIDNKFLNEEGFKEKHSYILSFKNSIEVYNSFISLLLTNITMYYKPVINIYHPQYYENRLKERLRIFKRFGYRKKYPIINLP